MAAVKGETDKLKGDYAGMATDVASVKQDMLDTVSRVESVEGTQEQQAKDIEKASGTANSAKTSAEECGADCERGETTRHGQCREDHHRQCDRVCGGWRHRGPDERMDDRECDPSGRCDGVDAHQDHLRRWAHDGDWRDTGDRRYWPPWVSRGIQGRCDRSQGPRRAPQGATGSQVPGEPGEMACRALRCGGSKGLVSAYRVREFVGRADGLLTVDSNRDYIGQYTDFTQADSSDPSKYTWSKIKGATGAQGLKGDPGATGLPGAPGADGRTSYAHFAYANSADGRTDFSTTNGTNKRYIGQYVWILWRRIRPTRRNTRGAPHRRCAGAAGPLRRAPRAPQGPQGLRCDRCDRPTGCDWCDWCERDRDHHVLCARREQTRQARRQEPLRAHGLPRSPRWIGRATCGRPRAWITAMGSGRGRTSRSPAPIRWRRPRRTRPMTRNVGAERGHAQPDHGR